jgi:biopolymer transport protein ExbD
MAISANKPVEGDETVHHLTRSKKKKYKPQKQPQPPMTPMIDVTFQLILFFVLTFEFRESEGMIPGTLPAKGIVVQSENTPLPLDPIQIRVIPSANRESASYEMTGVSVAIGSPRELGQLLQQRQAMIGSKEVPIVIFPTQDVPWGFVVEAFNQAKKARFLKIGFAQQIM